MPDRDPTPGSDQNLPSRKNKSYREADTKMRVYLDAQQDAVTHKVDEVIASFDTAPLPRHTGKDKTAFNPGDTYRHTVRQSSSIGRLLLVGLLLLGAGLAFYYLSASRKAAEPRPEAASAPEVPATARNEFAPPPFEEVATQAPASASEIPATVHKPDAPKTPEKPRKKTTRYSEDL